MAVLERWLPHTVTITDRSHCITLCKRLVDDGNCELMP